MEISTVGASRECLRWCVFSRWSDATATEALVGGKVKSMSLNKSFTAINFFENPICSGMGEGIRVGKARSDFYVFRYDGP